MLIITALDCLVAPGLLAQHSDTKKFVMAQQPTGPCSGPGSFAKIQNTLRFLETLWRGAGGPFMVDVNTLNSQMSKPRLRKTEWLIRCHISVTNIKPSGHGCSWHSTRTWIEFCKAWSRAGGSRYCPAQASPANGPQGLTDKKTEAQVAM